MAISFVVNGTEHRVEREPDTTLLHVLRNDLGLYGAKFGCGLEQCGACLVLVNDQPVCSCTARVGDLDGARIDTVERQGDRVLEALRQAFLDHNAAQCGYCTAGILIRARALLARDPAPDRRAIGSALDPQLCRCGAHPRVIRAVQSAAERLAGNER
jgi:aerobic-type carbon monoxide dehydrogenase small subunit (CoxS/CutS family)